MPPEEIQITTTLTLNQAHFLILAIDSGTINLASMQSTLAQVFFNKESESHTKELIEKINEVRGIIVGEVNKIKAE